MWEGALELFAFQREITIYNMHDQEVKLQK